MYDLIAEISTLIFSKLIFQKQQLYSQNRNLTEINQYFISLKTITGTEAEAEAASNSILWT